MVGMSASSNFPIQNLSGAFNQSTKFNTFEDLFIVRFDQNGVRQWATFIQTDYYAANGGMDVGPNNNLFLAGYFTLSYKFASTVPMINPGNGAYYQSSKSVNPQSSFNDEGYIMEFNTNGALVWSTYFGSSGTEQFEKIHVTVNGSIFLIGTAQTRQVTSGGTIYYPKLQSAGQYYDGSLVHGNPAKLFPKLADIALHA